jgi:hypothetical protein
MAPSSGYLRPSLVLDSRIAVKIMAWRSDLYHSATKARVAIFTSNLVL